MLFFLKEGVACSCSPICNEIWARSGCQGHAQGDGGRVGPWKSALLILYVFTVQIYLILVTRGVSVNFRTECNSKWTERYCFGLNLSTAGSVFFLHPVDVSFHTCCVILSVSNSTLNIYFYNQCIILHSSHCVISHSPSNFIYCVTQMTTVVYVFRFWNLLDPEWNRIFFNIGHSCKILLLKGNKAAMQCTWEAGWRASRLK